MNDGKADITENKKVADKAAENSAENITGEPYDNLIKLAARTAINEWAKTMNVQWLQRRFGIGTDRAHKLLEQMASLKFVEPYGGEYKVLVNAKLYNAIFGEGV